MGMELENETNTETYGLSNIKLAISLLSNGSEIRSSSGLLNPEIPIVTLANAFCSSPSLLSVYQACGCLYEGHLRQIVQLLVFKGLTAVRPAIRLLTVMRGLPGNVELSLQLLDQVGPSNYAALDTRTLALIARQSGPKVPRFSDFVSVLLSRIDDENSEDVRFALAHAFQTFYDPPSDPVFATQDWTFETRTTSAPSIWKEIKWAEFASRCCVSNGSLCQSALSLPDTDSAHFTNLPDSVGPAFSHYVSVCGVWFRRRFVHRPSLAISTASPTFQPINRDSNAIITPSVRGVLRDIASVLSFGMPLILEGPSGCGKTTILSLLARQTVENFSDFSPQENAPGVTFIQLDNIMSNTDDDSVSSLVGGVVPLPEGGGFRWRPGPISLALEHGDWLVFENIGSSASPSSSVAHIMSRLAELSPGDYFEPPGRGGPIRVALGFRCIATRTTSEDVDMDRWAPPGGWELWHRVRMQKLSDEESKSILEKKFPNVSDCVQRVMSVITSFRAYLLVKSGTVAILPSLREALCICCRLNSLRQSGGTMTTEMAFLECFDVLIAWCPPGKHKRDLLDILAACWSMSPAAAAKLLSTNIPSLSRDADAVRAGRATVHLFHSQESQLVSSKLCLNGHTLRLCEQVLRCIQVGESVLLTGEAGSGKTAVVQELSSILGKELAIVNLSRHSELSDLMGNFRPVEVALMIPQLAKKFEQLFCACMSKERNARFLHALQRAVRVSSHHGRALRLIKGATIAVPRHIKNKSSNSLQRWSEISNEVASLEKIFFLDSMGDERPKFERPKKRPRRLHDDRSIRQRRVEFKFCDGVLVKAMRAGHWVLLDEINLAPPDLLERLISVIDRGEVLLSDERGDPIKSHPEFTLFGAMNPPTDFGKKPLPSALKVRLTELHVDDIESRRDVIDLIFHRFYRRDALSRSSGHRILEEEVLAENSATFFLDCLKLAKDGRIEDPAEKPIRYSVRTLTRMLDFANGVRSFMKPTSVCTRRSLYEGALVAFGTSLPRGCKGMIRALAKRLLLGVSDRISLLSDMYGLNLLSSACTLEGFPLVSKRPACEDGGLSSEFILSPVVRQTLQEVCRVMLIGAPAYPILLQGPTAAGKTSVVVHLAECTGNQLVRINNHEHTELSEYLGGYIATEDGSLRFCEGPLVRAARLGEWVLLDELNLAPPDVLEALNRLLDDNREIFIPETGEVVKAVSGFRLFATQNPPGLYGGRKELSRAFRSRFVELQVDELPDEDLLLILEGRSLLPRSFVRGMVSVMRELQLRRRTSTIFTGREGFVTARDLFRWSSRRPRSKEELAMHGFFLLGERARHNMERETVRSVLVKSIGVSADVLSDKHLYGLRDFSSMSRSSQECLELSINKLGLSLPKLLNALSEMGIALTSHTRRMLILILHSMANKEPSLLVGPTGTGKTSCCFAICSALDLELLSINCHKHTDSSDMLGGFRPVRKPLSGGPLFEWHNGPLVDAMVRGRALLIDEINMADDAVIERLNSVLEPSRTLLLSEKGSLFSEDYDVLAPEQVKAKDSFVVLATMNPGGDFGKKELSPALRNRFTEIWMPQPHSLEDYVPIIDKIFSPVSFESGDERKKSVLPVLTGFLSCLLSEENSVDDGNTTTLISKRQFELTLRDLKSWCVFASKVSIRSKLPSLLALVHGARLVFLDGLSVGSADGWQTSIGNRLWNMLLTLLPKCLQSDAETFDFSTADSIRFTRSMSVSEPWCIEVGGFKVARDLRTDSKVRHRDESFSFDAPNTLRNTARLARAMCVDHHPLLLEGPPGGGKTSLISALAAEAGFSFLRVNLSETTEISDLVGSDAPGSLPGVFTFREGPLLKAMRQGSWLLLDELNLASQSVLEGLNSVLDHRRELYVPEVKEAVHAHDSFRLFGAQNPASEGGGRRGLPKSFLNRFIKVWVEPPDGQDVSTILSSSHPTIAQDIICKIVSVLERIKHVLRMKIPGMFGLRDALRWCDLLNHYIKASKPNIFCDVDTEQGGNSNMMRLLGVSFDVVILQGIPGESERLMAEGVFKSVFGYDWQMNGEEPVIRETPVGIRIGLAEMERTSNGSFLDLSETSDVCTGSANLREMQALSLATNFLWPVVLFSESSSRSRHVSRRLFDLAAASCGKRTYIISGGSLKDVDGFIGGYCQTDMTWAVHNCLREWHDLLRKLFCIVDTKHEKLISTLRKIIDFVYTEVPRPELIPRNKLLSFVEGFVISSHELLGLLEKNHAIPKHLNQHVVSVTYSQKQLVQLKSNVEAGDFASFEWRKSDLIQAIERGDWVLIHDADQCPPSVLDRINPLFERPPVPSAMGNFRGHKTKEMIIAEAPAGEDGSPMCIRPHPEFRMFFSVSSRGDKYITQGLSRALLDRSLRLYLSEALSMKSVPLFEDEPSFQRRYRYELASKLVRVPEFTKGSGGNGADSFNDYESHVSTTLNANKQLIQTGLNDLVLDTRTTIIERDLFALRSLERNATEIAMNLFAAVDIFENLDMNSQPTFLQNGRNNLDLYACRKLLHAGASVFLFSSSSQDDLNFRLKALTHLAEETSNPLHRQAFNSIISVGSVVEFSRGQSTECHDLALVGIIGVPLDPTFALDRSALLFLSRIQHANFDPTMVVLRAKKLRYEFLVVRKLQVLWKFGNDPSRVQPYRWTQAKREHELMEKGIPLPKSSFGIEVLAFKLVKQIVESCSSICNALYQSGSLSADSDMQWLNVFDATIKLCENLLDDDPNTTADFSSFFNLTSSLCSLCESKLLSAEVENLTKSVAGLVQHLDNCLNDVPVLLMPSTENGQELESKFLDGLAHNCRRRLSVLENRALTKAIVSVRDKRAESNSQLCETFSKLMAKIFNASEQLSSTREYHPIRHWELIAHNELLVLFRDMTVSLSLPVNQKALLDQISCVLERVTSSDSVAVLTAASVQRSFWLVDENRCADSGHRPILSDFLKELSATVHHVNDYGSTDPRSTVFSAVLELSRFGSTIPFWNLHTASLESLSAASLIMCGMHVIDVFDDKFTHLMYASAVSALDDLEMTSVANENDDLLQDSRTKVLHFNTIDELHKLASEFKCEDPCIQYLRCAVNAIAQISSWRSEHLKFKAISRRRAFHGTVWLCIGLARLTGHLHSISSFEGVDPSDVSIALMLSTIRDSLDALAGQKAYALVGSNRLGGEDPVCSEPYLLFQKRLMQSTSLFSRAQRRHVQRPSAKLPFKAYESALLSSTESVTRIFQNGLFGKLERFLINGNNDCIVNEIESLVVSCRSTANSLQCTGPLAHFRDCSPSFELGLRECEFGLVHIRKSFDDLLQLSNADRTSKTIVFSELSHFPRHAFPGSHLASSAIETCLKLSLDGNALIALAEYFVLISQRDGFYDLHDVSLAFAIIHNAWKTQLDNEEKEDERKSSLYILREEITQNSILWDDAAATLETNEEKDFLATFNSTNEELEQFLFGELENQEDVDSFKDQSADGVVVKPIKVNSELFFDLHAKVFSFSTALVTPPKSSSYIDCLNKMCGHLYSVVDGVAENTVISSSVWASLCALRIARQFVFESPKDSYNFYLDPNIVVLAETSVAFRSLCSTIQNLQNTFFKDIGSHPVLNEIEAIVEKISKSCKSGEALSNVVIGIEHVLRKIDEWHRLFSMKETRLDADNTTLSLLVLKLRKLEMSCWPTLLRNRLSTFERRAKRWFFLLYDIVIGQICSPEKALNESIDEIVSLLDQFLRSSPVGEFSSRIEMVISVSSHLLAVSAKGDCQFRLGHILYGVALSYSILEPGVNAQVKILEKGVYDKLSEFTKLVSWTATEDLGSSQVMSKQKLKHLEYYRLKAAAEKTRRRLHKLCLEMDGIYRQPVYEFISKELASIGLQFVIDDEKGKHQNLNYHIKEKFSETIDSVCQRLIFSDKLRVANANAFLRIEDIHDGFLSRCTYLTKRVNQYGEQLVQSNNASVDQAVKCICSLQKVIRHRVGELKSLKSPSVQLKKRSFTNLLHALRAFGLSPYHSANESVVKSIICFSTPFPTGCSEYDRIANDLYVTCFHHLRRLHDTSDSRARNTDITRDEASRAIAFCTQIFEQVRIQRAHLRKCVTVMGTVSEKATALKGLEFEPWKNFKPQCWQPTDCQEFQKHINRLKSSLEDVRVIEYILKTTESLSRSSSKNMSKDLLESSKVPIALRQIQDAVYIGKVGILAKKATSSVIAIQEFLDDENVSMTRAASPRNLSFLDRRLDVALSKTGLLLKELKAKLTSILEESLDVPSSNVLAETLIPIIELLNAFNMTPQDIPIAENEGIVEPDLNITQSKTQANEVLQCVLICVQRVIDWSDIHLNSEKSCLDEPELCENILNFPNILKMADKKLNALHIDYGLEELLKLMEKNENFLDIISSTRTLYRANDASEIVQMQRQVGGFVVNFLNQIITPTLQKVARYHSYLMSLLRTLASLFVGLFEEGYCRPVEELDGCDENVEDVSGTGFGEVNGGDLSHAQNVSKEIEDEEQLVGLMKDEQYESSKEQNPMEQMNEDAVDMTADFDGDLADDPNGKNDDDENDEADEAERHLSEEHAKGKNEVDERMWQGDDSSTFDKDPETGGPDRMGENELSNELVAGEENAGSKDDKDKNRGDLSDRLAQPEEGVHTGTESNEDSDSDCGADDKNQVENLDDSTRDKTHRDGKPLDEAENNESNTDVDFDREEGEQGESADQGGDLDNTKGDVPEAGETKEVGRGGENETETGSNNENQNASSRMDDQDPVNTEKAENDVAEEQNDYDTMTGDPSDTKNDAESDELIRNKDLSQADDLGEIDMDVGELSEGKSDDDNFPNDEMSMDSADVGEIENDISKEADNLKSSEGDADEREEDSTLPDSAEPVPGVATTDQASKPKRNESSMNVFPSEMGSGATFGSGKPEKCAAECIEDGMDGLENDGKGTNLEGLQNQSHASKMQSSDDAIPKNRLFQEANPLRATTDTELIQHWKKYIDAVENERNDDYNDDRVDDGGENLEFAGGSNHNHFEKVVLAEATNEQHVPLPPVTNDNDDDDLHSVRSHDDEEITTNTKDRASQSIGGLSPHSNPKKDEGQNFKTERATQDLVESSGPEVRAHPARKVLERKEHHRPPDFGHATAEMPDDTPETGTHSTEGPAVMDINLKRNWVVENLSEEEACNLWRDLEAKVSHEANMLCERLRLVLEPTTRSSLAGGYRTGKRLNMRKIIEYVASDFRKDRVWLRRTKADKRSYDVMIAIDDSASMIESECGAMALESVALLLSAMGKLEVGRVAVVSFGSDTRLVRDFDEALPMSPLKGGQLLQHFTFSQTETDLVNLLDFAWKKVVDDALSASSEKERLSLLFVISDGRLSNRQEIKRYIRRMKDENVLVAAVIVDKKAIDDDALKAGNTTTSSIFDVKRVEYDGSGNISVVPYMYDFPIPFYVVVQDPRIMPSVLSNALKHWIEVATACP